MRRRVLRALGWTLIVIGYPLALSMFLVEAGNWLVKKGGGRGLM